MQDYREFHDVLPLGNTGLLGRIGTQSLADIGSPASIVMP